MVNHWKTSSVSGAPRRCVPFLAAAAFLELFLFPTLRVRFLLSPFLLGFLPSPFFFQLPPWMVSVPPLLKSQKPPPSPTPHLCDQRALARIPSTDICHRSVFLNNKPMLIPPFTTACFPFTAASIAELVPATEKSQQPLHIPRLIYKERCTYRQVMWLQP